MRAYCVPSSRARTRTVSVFAVPGTPSMSAWPPASSATTTPKPTRSPPTTTRANPSRRRRETSAGMVSTQGLLSNGMVQGGDGDERVVVRDGFGGALRDLFAQRVRLRHARRRVEASSRRGEQRVGRVTAGARAFVHRGDGVDELLGRRLAARAQRDGGPERNDAVREPKQPRERREREREQR